MPYAVVLDVITSKEEKQDYKHFESLETAKKQYYEAWVLLSDERPNKQGIYVERARLIEINTTNSRKAIDRVKQGQGKVIEDTDSPFPDIVIDV